MLVDPHPLQREPKRSFPSPSGAHVRRLWAPERRRAMHVSERSRTPIQRLDLVWTLCHRKRPGGKKHHGKRKAVLEHFRWPDVGSWICLDVYKTIQNY